MLSSNSTFVKTEIPVWQTSTKSLIFRAAELLLVLAIWKTFSLLAAVQDRFTSYIVFSESPIQKASFVWSRGLSKDAFLVISFSAICGAAQLYGTLLWAMDAPGYVTQTQLTPASPTAVSLLNGREYIVSYTVSPDNITDTDLAEELSVNLFRRGTNLTLTGSFDQGVPEIVPPPRLGAGPRIWLDDEGWSVTTDSTLHISVKMGATDVLDDQLACEHSDRENATLAWRTYNCTFKSEWIPDLLQKIVGIPEVHWNAAADLAVETPTFSKIDPMKDDIWASLGRGSGTEVRIHMFTVTKGHRRHTFVSTIIKTSVAAINGELPEDEVEDLIRRTNSLDPQKQKEEEPAMSEILKTIMAAQKNNRSATVGVAYAKDYLVLESSWDLLLRDDFPGNTFAGVFRYTNVNITLIRSETIPEPPVPFESCKNAFQNQAVGGRVVSTDCFGPGAFAPNDIFYFGQVDTSAALHLRGLGHSPYESSAAALDPLLYTWVVQNAERLTRLLLSRGYTLGLDPKLVTVQLTTTTPGISYIQLFLALLAPLLAAISWGSLWLFASGYWSSSFLVNLLAATRADCSNGSKGPRVVCQIPDIRLKMQLGSVKMSTDTGVFVHQDDEMPTSDA